MLLPGRLGNSQSSLATDPRTHRGLLKGLEAHGMQYNTFLTASITPNASLAEIIAFAHESEKALESMIHGMDFGVLHPSPQRSITVTQVFIPGVNENQIQLSIYRPADEKNSQEELPAVLYFHGGGMVMLSTQNRLHTSYAEAIARSGLVAILVDFRNVLSNGNPEVSSSSILNPFPAGLDDCVSAARWIHKHKQNLRISKIVLHGDSGGANLALATALRLNISEDTKATIDGVFAVDPYISGAYDQSREWKLENLLQSLVECDGYDVSCSSCSIYARLYDLQGKFRNDRFAWPYWATESDLCGLPPHVIMVAELDPLRDEGIEYCRKLVRAGVRSVGRVRLGMTHTGDLLLRKYVPDEFLELLDVLRGFVDRL